MSVKNESFQILKSQNPEYRVKGDPVIQRHVTKQLDIFLKTIFFPTKSESYGFKISNEIENIYLKGQMYSRSNLFLPTSLALCKSPPIIFPLSQY